MPSIPDERVAGKGVSWLTDARVEVLFEESAAEAESVDPADLDHRRTGLPLVTWKTAMTLDGSVEQSRWHVAVDQLRGGSARRPLPACRS